MNQISIAFANAADRADIYRLRHAVYAAELAQHAVHPEGRLTDALDPFNEYLVARLGGELAAFICLTPPGHGRYSVDKYFSREELPFPVDASLYEVRLLTVPSPRRGQCLAVLLMYAAFRWIASQGGTRIVAIGREELAGFYGKAGLQLHGRKVRSGAVTYELMSATIPHLQQWAVRFQPLLKRLENSVRWDLDLPFFDHEPCFHGGAFFEAVGDTFETLERSTVVINADVLDAWFPPAPGVIAAMQEYLPWLLRTSPPQDGRGLVETIARVRGLPPESILPGAGSSSLIYLAFREWLGPQSRVLLPDPTYGEYAHVLENVIGCHVDRLPLSRANGFRIDPAELVSRLAQQHYDLFVLVNPNNPTGRLLPREVLEPLLATIPSTTRVWVDEAYVEYAGAAASVETLAARSPNVVVCKSMSKVYALSGARVAYLCGYPSLIRPLRRITPPWAVSLPAQVAAVAALNDPAYYGRRYRETAALRKTLARDLRTAVPGVEVVESIANFVLCYLPPWVPDAATTCDLCRTDDVFIRDIGRMSKQLGPHALRIAVKDAAANRRIVTALAKAVGITKSEPIPCVASV